MRQSFDLIILSLIVFSCNTNRKEKSIVYTMQPDTSTVKIFWDTMTFKLDSCVAIYSDEQLNLNFQSKNDFKSHSYGMFIVKNKNNTSILVRETAIPTDTTYVSSYFKPLRQELNLEDTIFSIGARISGEINLLLLAHKPYFRVTGEMERRIDFDTIQIRGHFVSTIK